LWAKGLNAKDINKKCFLFKVVSVRSVEQFTTESRNCQLGGKRFADDEEAETTMLWVLTHW
jgi:hypothetical protein